MGKINETRRKISRSKKRSKMNKNLFQNKLLSKVNVLPLSTAKIINQLGSRTSRTMSYESQSSRKRKSIDKSSKHSKQSVRTNKSNIVGTLSKSGISLGQLMSYNYQGSVTKSVKSLKNREKRGKQVVKSAMINENDLEKLKVKSPPISEINLEAELGEDFELAFNKFKLDENYNFTGMNDTLEMIEHKTKELMKIYDTMVGNLKEKIALIDFKKNDLFKIKCYKESMNLRCCSNETINLDDTERNLAINIIELMDEIVKLKEELLTAQSDMKINVGEYHRIRHSINDEFKHFCIETYNLDIPATAEQISNCIEDKLVLPEIVFKMKDGLKETIEKATYEKYQFEMKKMQTQRLK